LWARLVGYGGRGVSVRQLGGSRAGEMRITRFLHNPQVTVGEMLSTARERTCAQVAGRHVLSIQDTSALRVDEKGVGLSFHPVLAVDANEGTVLGLVDNFFLERRGGERATRKQRAFEDKDSRRWLSGAQSAGVLAAAGAACVTVIEDREGDIYECFAFKPAGVEKLVRAAQDRRLADGTTLFSKAAAWDEAGRMGVEIPAAPGRQARTAELSVSFGPVAIVRPGSRKASDGLPPTIPVTLVIGRESDPPAGEEPALWFLLTTHRVNDIADARRIIGFYRLRWTIEQLFRTMKTKGFAIEALRQQQEGPLEKLVTAILIAAVTVMQLVAERDGKTRRPLADVFDPDDQPALERVCQSLEGKTAKQKNPHPNGSLAYTAWVFARLGGWTGYYGKPGPIVMLRGLTQFHAIKHGWSLRYV
jgi:Transposase DDE domain